MVCYRLDNSEKDLIDPSTHIELYLLKKKKFLFINSEVHLSYTCKQNLQREDSACRLCEDIYLHAVQNSQTLLVEKKSLQKIP